MKLYTPKYGKHKGEERLIITNELEEEKLLRGSKYFKDTREFFVLGLEWTERKKPAHISLIY